MTDRGGLVRVLGGESRANGIAGSQVKALLKDKNIMVLDVVRVTDESSSCNLAPIGVEVSAQEVDIVGEDAQGRVLRLSRSQGGDQDRGNGGGHGDD